ncbi:tyrosinase family protein [Streptomyces sp. RFCAC02]|uniref:tyrosinase family protein n=1 Tax=Streptomyces sp. RFCAC02 TaxID=2499143 RepID=UPI0010208A4B|nr:tyrosinase family protein [Streptomyces sp. RFCAC02]
MTVSRRSLLLAGGAAALGAGLPRASVAVSGETPLRRDVATLIDPATGAWDPALHWYAKAVGWMKRQPVDRWDSWLFQAYTHGKPEAAPDDPPEWRQCPHGSPLFLPWHRWYVLRFERIVRRVIVEEFGRDDQAAWALPYWNYAHLGPDGDPGGSAGSRRVPLAFRQPYLPAAHGDAPEPNPLHLPSGDPAGRCLRDDEAMGWDIVAPDRAMAEPAFGPDEEGTDPRAGFSATLELYPHGLVHDAVGGLLGAVPTAAQDPLFWLHHANVDRLWAAWLARPGHTLPEGQHWPGERPDHTGGTGRLPYLLRDEYGRRHLLTGPVFAFPDDAYRYDSLTDGTGTGAAPAAVLMAQPPRGGSPVADSAGGVRLGDRQVVLPLEPVDALAGTSLADALDGDRRVVLTLDGVAADHPPCETFAVFLGGDTADTDTSGPAFVGHPVFFGAAARPGHGAAGDGRSFHFDVTGNLAALRAAGSASGRDVPAVRIVPGRGAVHEAAAPRIGAVRLTVV